MISGIPLTPGLLNLQSTLSAATHGPHLPQGVPHHPITCPGPLAYFEDGTFACGHGHVGPDDQRTQFAVDQSIVILLFELAAAWATLTPLPTPLPIPAPTPAPTPLTAGA